MARHPEPLLPELLWTVACSRLLLGGAMSIQAPPNLTPEAGQGQEELRSSWLQLLAAGINDWGGVSPVTRDWVNPERSWPQLEELAAATAAGGKLLLPRLPVYPTHLRPDTAAEWLDGAAGRASPLAAALRQADAHGLARCSFWYAGVKDEAGEAEGAGSVAPAAVIERAASGAAASTSIPEQHTGSRSSVPPPRRRSWRVELGPDGVLKGCARPAHGGDPGTASPQTSALLEAVLSPTGHELSEAEMEALFAARGADFDAVCSAADALRRRVNGDTVSYVVNRNLQYTNICR
jgi:FO synthase